MQKILITTVMFAATLSASPGALEPYDLTALAKFRADREMILKRDTGWLTVAGLHFLNQGDNRVGSDPSNDIVSTFPASRSTWVSSRCPAPTSVFGRRKARRC